MTLRQEINNFVKQNAEQWLRETVLEEAKRHSRAANMPPAFTNSIRLKRAGRGFKLENAWRKSGKPLAIFFEFGTRDHWVAPLSPKGVLAWHAPDQNKTRHGKAIYFKRHGVKKGDKLFSKGHFVSGLPRLEPMHQGYRAGRRLLRDKIKTEITKKFTNNSRYNLNIR